MSTKIIETYPTFLLDVSSLVINLTPQLSHAL